MTRKVSQSGLAQAKPASLIRPAFSPIPLPEPTLDSSSSLERCMRNRRSCRDFRDAPVPLKDISQLLWAAQGVTGLGGLRTAPSAGALYALKMYVAAANVAGLAPGVYRYDPDGHELLEVSPGERRKKLMKVCADQKFVAQAAVVFALAGNYARVSREYGDRSNLLLPIEAGHIGQNICLEATALGLGVIGMGSFDSAGIKSVLEIAAREEPVYLLAAGWKF